MSRRIFRDVEEALARETRRITFHDQRTTSTDVLPELFDPLTGDVITGKPIQPSFYDSSADAANILYPHIFIKLVKTREDRFTGRIIPPYGQFNVCYSPVAPKAYKIVFNAADGLIPVVGSALSSSTYKLARIQPGYLLRIVSGNNKGTYTITGTDLTSTPGKINVSNTVLQNLPALMFEPTTRKLYFDSTDLNTVKIGDNLLDSSATSFPITAIDLTVNSITIGGLSTPNASTGASINRAGNVFTLTDVTPVKYVILDPSQPVLVQGQAVTSGGEKTSPQIPIDAYYLVRIDSKERINHIDILNRIWEEFNPPRTALPVIVRSKDSAETTLEATISPGGSSTITVKSNVGFKVGDPVYIFDDLSPSKSDYGFQQPLITRVVGKVATNQLTLAQTVPDTYTPTNGTRIVSNASYQLLMFHFVNHDTRDNEGAQYWVHELTFWVQVWIDRLEDSAEFDSTILDISTPIENLSGDVIIQDS